MYRSTKYFLIVIGIVFLTLTLSCVNAYNQNRLFEARDRQYKTAIGLQGIDPEGAVNLLLDLDENNQNNYLIYYKLGQSYFNLGNYPEAIKYFQKTVKQRPFMVRLPVFSLQYAQTAYKNQDLKTARIYLKNAKEIGVPEKYKTILIELEENLLKAEGEKIE